MPCCPTKSLYELMKFLLTYGKLKSSRPIVPRNFTIHIDYDYSELAQNFMTTMTIMGVSQVAVCANSCRVCRPIVCGQLVFGLE